MYYVYILHLSNSNLYKGSCEDLKARLVQHERGWVKSTKNYRPLKLIHYEAYCLKTDARRRERYLKTTEGRRFLRQQIRDFLLNHSGIV
jgi:putative endonuclease